MTNEQSTFDAIATGVGAEDIESLAFLADDLQGFLEWWVVGVSLDIDEEEVGRVAVAAAVGDGERLDPGHVDPELFERGDRLGERAGLVGQADHQRGLVAAGPLL